MLAWVLARSGDQNGDVGGGAGYRTKQGKTDWMRVEKIEIEVRKPSVS